MKELFRIIDPLFGENNIYKMQARRTVSLGPVMVGTVANKNLPWIEVEIINENNCRKKLGAPLNQDGILSHFDLQRDRKAEYIGISASMTNAVPRALKIIKDYKHLPENLQPKAIIVGGWHAGDSPMEFLRAGANVVVRGEAEKLISPLLNTLKRNLSLKNLPGISYLHRKEQKDNLPGFISLTEEDLENLPCPDFGLVCFAKIKLFPMGRTRGCSGRCRFCRVRTEPRSISPEKFIRQVETVASKGAKKFFLIDDRSEEDLEGFKKVLLGLVSLRKQKSLRLEFTSQNRLSLAEKPEVLALMREAGIRTVAIGFESPIPEELKAMRKPINPQKMVEWTKTFKNNGLYVHAMMIFGYPLSTCADPEIVEKMNSISIKEKTKKFWDFIRTAKPDSLQVLLYTPIIGTPDYAFLEENNRLRKDLSWEFYDGTHLVFVPDEGIDPRELQEESIKLMRKFYSFNFFWRFGRISLVLNSIRFGLITIAMPFIWLLNLKIRHFFYFSFKKTSSLAWQSAKRSFRKAKISLGGSSIISSWLKKFKKMGPLWPNLP